MQESKFDNIWYNSTQGASILSLEEPKIPRSRNVPKRYKESSTSNPHIFHMPKDYYRKMYFKFFDHVTMSMNNRFNSEIMKKLLLNSLKNFGMGKNNVTVQEIIQFYNFTPKSDAKSENCFDEQKLKLSKNYLRSMMKQKHLNHYIAILYIYREMVEKLNMEELINNVIKKNKIRAYFCHVEKYVEEVQEDCILYFPFEFANLCYKLICIELNEIVYVATTNTIITTTVERTLNTSINHKDFVTQTNNEMNLNPISLDSLRENFSGMLYHVYTISFLTKYDPHNDNIATSCDEQYHRKYQRPEELLPPWQIEWPFLINEDAIEKRLSQDFTSTQTIKDTMVSKSLSLTVTNDVYHVTSENLTICIRMFVES
ncbi:hypothetical protein ALC57_13403 [Trachymyrmex cornetzi]|uniref:Uncharacterized protein n=1 Tax=Trachymyrmex cornetzi TaxID=471704 RepID=A0A195DN32_9HYME|nr:hypothetical protein ALC57_13403 [Trachymyrmex cornetzi]